VALVSEKPEVALVRQPKGKRRRTCGSEGSEVKESEVEIVEVEVVEEGIIVATSIPRELKGIVVVAGAPVGPRMNPSFGRGGVNPNSPLFFNPSW